MMTIEAIKEVKKEAIDFVSAAAIAINRMRIYILNAENIANKEDAERWQTISSKETASLRRKSMELTRSLSRLRSYKQ